MSVESSLSSKQLERHVLGGLMKHPEILFDLENVLSEKDFFNETHSTIFSVLKSIIFNKEKPDKVIVAQKIKNLGISFKDDIEIFKYIDTLAFTTITADAAINATKELVKLRVCRELYENAAEVQKFLLTGKDKSIDEIISHADKCYNSQVMTYKPEHAPRPLFVNIEERLEERALNPLSELGFSSPFARFNALMGGFQNSNVYCFCSRSGEGKTTLLNFLTMHIHEFYKIPVLNLDTEMEEEDIEYRILSAIMGVPFVYLKQGLWKKNPIMAKRVKENMPRAKNVKGFDFKCVGNKTVDEVCSIIRRWYFGKVGRGNPAIVTYDYLKMTGEAVGQNWAEYQVMGDKLDKLHCCIKEINVPLLTAIQLNRANDMAMSDRIRWFSSYVGFFQRKSPQEVELDGPRWGTHKLVTSKARFQGIDGVGHDIYVQRTINGETQYLDNYINFRVQNFGIEELGTLKELISEEEGNLNVQDSAPVTQLLT